MPIWNLLGGAALSYLTGQKKQPRVNIPTPFATPQNLGTAQNVFSQMLGGYGQQDPAIAEMMKYASRFLGQDPSNPTAQTGMEQLANRFNEGLTGANRNVGWEPGMTGLRRVQSDIQNADPSTQPYQPGQFNRTEDPLAGPTNQVLAGMISGTGPSSEYLDAIRAMQAASAGPQRELDTGLRQRGSLLGGLRSSAFGTGYGKAMNQFELDKTSLFANMALSDLARRDASRNFGLSLGTERGQADFGNQLNTFLTNQGQQQTGWENQREYQRDILDRRRTEADISSTLANLGLSGAASERADVGTMADLWRGLFGMGNEASANKRADFATFMSALLGGQAYEQSKTKFGFDVAQSPYWSPTGPQVQQSTDYSGAMQNFANLLPWLIGQGGGSKSTPFNYGGTAS